MTQPLSPTKDDQIAFLKKNEALMTTYIKSISDDSPNKITSVTYDWGDVSLAKEDASSLIGKYDILVINAYVNNDSEQGVGISVEPNNFDELDFIQCMWVAGARNKFFELYDPRDGNPWKEYYK